MNLGLSKRLKQAADCWLNNPRVPREASGTSGMTAAMNGAVNFSTDDGWIPEFIQSWKQWFCCASRQIIKTCSVQDQDEYDLEQMYEILKSKYFLCIMIIMKPGARS